MDTPDINAAGIALTQVSGGGLDHIPCHSRFSHVSAHIQLLHQDDARQLSKTVSNDENLLYYAANTRPSRH